MEKIAIIGGGPRVYSAAYDLASLMGFFSDGTEPSLLQWSLWLCLWHTVCRDGLLTVRYCTSRRWNCFRGESIGKDILFWAETGRSVGWQEKQNLAESESWHENGPTVSAELDLTVAEPAGAWTGLSRTRSAQRRKRTGMNNKQWTGMKE